MSFLLYAGSVLDETDGKLVHLHGVNFSRAWNIYSLVKRLSAIRAKVEDPTAQFAFKGVRYCNPSPCSCGVFYLPTGGVEVEMFGI